jgi:hypothetical protein
VEGWKAERLKGWKAERERRLPDDPSSFVLHPSTFILFRLGDTDQRRKDEG